MKQSDGYQWKEGDLLRYAEGRMEEEERAAFERALEGDPFLREALDGIRMTGAEKARASINRLRRGRAARQGGLRRRTLLGTAAAVLLVAVGFWVISDMATESTDPIAQDIRASDNAGSGENEVLSPEAIQLAMEAEEEGQPGSGDHMTEKSGESPAGKDVEERKMKQPADGKEDDQAGGDPREPEELLSRETATLSENTPKSADKNTIPETIRRSGAGKQSAPAENSRYLMMDRAAAPEPTADPDLPAEEAKPVGGMESLQAYLAENARDGIAGRGVVRLAFRIGDGNRAADILVLRSECPDCEKEAIRLIREGPIWENAIGAWVYIDLFFPVRRERKRD